MNFFFNFLAMASGMAAPITRYVRRRWLRTLIWSLAACLVIYFYGDVFQMGRFRPLEGDERRLIACGVVLVCWVVYNIVQLVRDRRADRKMIDAVTDASAAGKGDRSAEELEQLRTRLQDALGQLRKLTGRRRSYLYQLPWYMLIGSPGSGKTTALLNSGLRFPLADKLGREPVAGVGGTRNCDWLFTEDAILLDTAGRYTTQDSDPERDQKAWTGFLGLLKQHRPLQPVNGVVVSVSLADIVGGDPGERLNMATALRARLHELSRTFGSRFPIYVLLTKADLIAGFVQFFDAFSRSDREQVWGITFPLDDGKPDSQPAVARFDIEFDALLTRMNAVLLERLQQETDVQRRGLIYGFPLQVATLKDQVREVLEEIFVTSKFDTRPLLRGVYLTSSTQVGAPIDRLMHAMAANFGMDAPRLAPFAGQDKSYFLTRLLNQVVFAEANVVAADPRLRRRMATTRRTALAVAAVVVVGLLGSWGVAYSRNRVLVARADEQNAAYVQAVSEIPVKDVSDADFARVVPPLNRLRDDPARLRRDSGGWLNAGLDQSSKLQSQYAELYGRALNELLLPRVLVFLQKQMHNGRTDDDDFKTAALKVYLGLGGQGPLDKGFARTFMKAEWASVYPDAGQADLRGDLDSHFGALLDVPLEPIALDAGLISDVRGQIGREPLAARAYAVLRDGATAQALPSWTVAGVAGAVADRAFTRQSGQPLTDGIPGFYTRKGYTDVFLPGLKDAVAQADKDRWVFGAGQDVAADQAAAATDAVSLYRGDFVARWTALLTDLRIRPLSNLQQSVLILTALSGPDSVFQKLLNGIIAQTDLSPPGDDAKDPESQRIKALIAASGPTATAAEQPFQPLRNATRGQDGQPSQVAQLLQTLNDVYGQLSRAANSPSGVMSVAQTGMGLNDANQKLLSQARQMPSPVDVWLSSLSGDLTSVGSGTARTAISQAWAASGERFCRQATAGRYPFNRRGGSEISPDDFSQLFSAGGVMDRFFNENLRPYVDTSRRPWTWQYNSNVGVSSAFLAQFEHADVIRQAFFGGGSAASFRYDVSPNFLDPSANQVTLDIGGQTLTYANGPVRPTTFVWPAPRNTGVRLDVEPGGLGSAIDLPGLWAPFRLFDMGQVSARTRDSFTVTLTASGRRVAFDVHSNAVLNPFTLPDLRLFSCPGSL